MATFEDVRMIDLIKKFESTIEKLYSTKQLSLMQKASPELQAIYNFHATSDASFIEIEQYLKNMYSSFNYAAVICNEGLKKKSLDKEDGEMLMQCLEIMLKCCELIKTELNKK